MKKTVRRMLGTAAVSAALAALAFSVPAAADTEEVAVSFETPTQENSISTRWWIPGAAVTEDEIRREVQLLAEEGFQNVELVYFPLSVDGRMTVSEKFGWDTEDWKNVLKWAFDEGEKQGVKINLTTGPMWPSMSPLITPDDEAAEKELNFGVVRLQAGETYEGTVPMPNASDEAAVTKEQLIAVTVAKISSFDTEVTESTNWMSGATVQKTTNNVVLASDSLQDITAEVVSVDGEEATISFTAPDDGEYLLFGFWQRGTGQVGNSNSKGMIASNPQSYCVDHLSTIGVDALTDYWDQQFLSNEEIASYISENNPEIFEDSLELIHTLLWTPKMTEEFEARRGYSMTAYLPLLYGTEDNDEQGGGDMNGYYVFTTDDTDSDSLFVSDYEQTVSDLYIDNHVRALKEWCEKVGFQYKTQSYGETVDTAVAYAITDVPEGESLEYGADNYNAFRAVAAAAHLTGKSRVSAEYGAVMGSGFAQTWDDLLVTFNKIASAGVDRVILHGFPYEDYQGSDSQNADTVIPWPGFDPFNDLFADHWNSHQPSWDSMDIYTSYISRTQSVLQTGESDVDFAVYYKNLDVIDGPYYDSTALSNLGYSMDYVSGSLLKEAGATVTDGRLGTEHTSYPALVIPSETEMSVEDAEAILFYAEAGLKIYFVGELTFDVPGLADNEANTATVAETLEKILACESVKTVADTDELIAALAADGVTSDASYAEATNIYALHRSAEDADYYFFNNAGEDAVSTTVTLTGSGVPYIMDAWTGEITSCAEYTVTDAGVTVPVDLEKNEAVIYAVAPENSYGTIAAAFAVTDSNAEVVNEDGNIYMIADADGTYNLTLSDGSSIELEVSGLPEAVELSGETWTLNVESWTAAEIPEGDTSGNNTEKTALDPIKTTLKAWTEIEGLEDVSGIGTYSLTFDLDWEEGTGAKLVIGDVIDNITAITVNGTAVTRLDQLVQTYDLGTLLVPGENTIEITIATTLNNAVNKIGEYKPIFGEVGPQSYGLTGTVTLVPYAKAEITQQ